MCPLDTSFSVQQNHSLYRDTMYYEYKEFFCQYPRIKRCYPQILSTRNCSGKCHAHKNSEQRAKVTYTSYTHIS
jgi:hypothetical protein